MVAPVARSGFAAINSDVATFNGNSVYLNDFSYEASETAAQSPAPALSKKRKQPGSSAVSGGYNTGSLQAKSRGNGDAHRRFAETNMLAFDRSGAQLNSRGQLVADDGTALSPNGKSKAFPWV